MGDGYALRSMQAWCTTASISSVVIPGRMYDAAVSRTSRASCEMSGIMLVPCLQSEAGTYPANGSHLFLLLWTQYARRLAGTPRLRNRNPLKAFVQSGRQS
jgi:hypothetical protein